MLKVLILLSVTFFNCAGSKKNISNLNYEEKNEDLASPFISCSGKGNIRATGNMDGSLSFSFKSQNDSTFFQFSDPLGRKVLLMWISSDQITGRNLIENKQYDYDEIESLFPLLKVLKPNDVTSFFWGEKPTYNKKDKSIPIKIRKNIKLDFSGEKNKEQRFTFNIADFYDHSTGQKIRIDIKNRKLNTEFINIKKFWKLLKY